MQNPSIYKNISLGDLSAESFFSAGFSTAALSQHI